MPMITDTERREVARRLLELPDDSTYPDLIGAIADHDGWYAAADMADRLADLIEPSYDRDALLTVAETMDQDAFLYREAANSFTECRNHDAAEICYEAAGEYNDYAKVIREALGVQDA